MLDEELQLRAYGHHIKEPVWRKQFYADIRSLVKSVREDCAKVGHDEVLTWTGPIAEANREMIANGVADAIRARDGRKG